MHLHPLYVSFFFSWIIFFVFLVYLFSQVFICQILPKILYWFFLNARSEEIIEVNTKAEINGGFCLLPVVYKSFWKWKLHVSHKISCLLSKLLLYVVLVPILPWVNTLNVFSVSPLILQSYCKKHYRPELCVHWQNSFLMYCRAIHQSSHKI